MSNVEEVVGNRFKIEREAGAGAMARVYRARDITTDTFVALKILNGVGEHAMRRFAREVGALVDLTHPTIVRYIAHGRTESGHAFLAMEWLDGESLESRLARGPLTIDESLALAAGIARALGAAHQRGIVHRDVKPANIFLVGGDPAQPKLLDFGLVRDTQATYALTGTGDLLGTPLFMAPEQASCDPEIDARVDVYALGAVLYMCIAGKPPLLAPNLVGLLAKIVLEEPPRLAIENRHVPPAIDDLVAGLLAKKRNERPADGTAAEAAIRAAVAGLGSAPRRAAAVPSREQRVVSILLATQAPQDPANLDATLGSFGGVLGLADGSTMVVFAGPETPGDLAARAARYALGLRTPVGAVALATGRAVLSGPTPMGEVIDRAAGLLSHAAGRVRVDAETAGLIEGRFEVSSDDRGAIIVGERTGELDPVRTLLGKPTRCIGRDRELAAIEGHFAQCISESAACAVIVLADAGIGKSRLAHELLRRLSSHSEAPEVILARCESITETSPFAAVAAALRRSAGIDPSDSPVRRTERLAGLLARDQVTEPEVAEFLAEILAIPIAQPSERMRAARENPTVMFDHIRSAWTSWLRRACVLRPLLLVIEDLHWADESSVMLVDAALAALVDERFMVLALARPEVRDRKPWATRRPHELRLDPLARRASERLVRDALGSAATDDIVANILSRAEGNALFLEELVRAATNPNVTALPVGVIGTVQLRFDTLRPEARAVLRVASVFGERFSRAGVAALVPASSDVAAALDQLVAEELVGQSVDGYAFRHALVREAAYALLPDEDRMLAHALAAEFLEQGEHEPAVIARHFELGQRFSAAARWYLQAAERALAHNELRGALTHARSAQTWTEDAISLGTIDLLIADAQFWLGHLDEARSAALRAADRIPTASPAWFNAVGLIITTAGQLGDNDIVAHWLERAMELDPAVAAVSSFVVCLSRASSQLAWGDRGDLARRALQHADLAAEGHELGPIATARLEFARAFVCYLDGFFDAGAAIQRRVVEMYDRIGAVRDALQLRLIATTMQNFLGQHPNAEIELLECVQGAEHIEARYLAAWARFEYAAALMLKGDRVLAKSEFAAVPPDIRSTPLFRYGHALVSSWAALVDDDVGEIERLVTALDGIPTNTRYRAALDAFAAFVQLRRGNPRACDMARDALARLATAPGMQADIQLAGFTAALETLVAANTPDAASAVAAHRARLNAMAAKLKDPYAKEGFLVRVPWNRRLADLGQ